MKILKLLKSMYSNITAGVRPPNDIADLFQSKIGVRQRCNLSPVLFNLFINDIVDSVDNGQNTLYLAGKLNNISINHLLYADDLVFISESATGLQRRLNDLNSFCDKWHMKSNLTNNFYCDLGTMISSCGSFSLSMRIQYKKGIKAMFALLSSIIRTAKCFTQIVIEFI